MNILSQGYEDNDRDFRLEQFEKDKNMLAFWLQKQEDAQRAVDVANTNIEYLTKNSWKNWAYSFKVRR